MPTVPQRSEARTIGRAGLHATAMVVTPTFRRRTCSEEFDLAPLEIGDLSGAQAMPERHHDKRGTPAATRWPMPAMGFCRVGFWRLGVVRVPPKNRSSYANRIRTISKAKHACLCDLHEACTRKPVGVKRVGYLSALPPIADMKQTLRHVRKVP
jgi:hypothetical protein